MHSLLNMNKSQNQNIFLSLSQPEGASVGPFGPYNKLKWQISIAFHILKLVKSLPFQDHIPEALTRYPFWAAPPWIGYYRESLPRGDLALLKINVLPENSSVLCLFLCCFYAQTAYIEKIIDKPVLGSLRLFYIFACISAFWEPLRTPQSKKFGM